MKIILHADMNSYFASVEQQANPFLRGKPLAICSRVSKNACIIACSVEAKKLGIKTGFSLFEAKSVCPSIIAMEVDPPKIRTVTKKIFSIFADFTSAIEEYSIDEAFLDLTGMVGNFAEAQNVAQTIKQRIKNEVGDWLKCSVGIASTRWLAKFASELQKPDGLTVLKTEELPLVYLGRPVDEAWGIAAGWKERLSRLGIYTLDQLLVYNPLELKRIFGISAYVLWSNIAGLDLEQTTSPFHAPPKSIGHSYVFHHRTSRQDEVLAIMMKLSERVGRRLRAAKMEARTISVYWRYETDGDGGRTKCFDPIFGSMDIFKTTSRLFKTRWHGQKVTYAAITAHDLIPTSGQVSFLPDRHRQKNISQALDRANNRYGDYTIVYGQMWGTAASAPDRIGFRQTMVAPTGHDTY